MAYNTFVKKETVNAVIRTSGEKIEGKISKLPHNRLLDMLNQGRGEFYPSYWCDGLLPGYRKCFI